MQNGYVASIAERSVREESIGTQTPLRERLAG
jgi:hypothetical protein